MKVWYSAQQLAFKRSKMSESEKVDHQKYHRGHSHLSNSKAERMRKLDNAVKLKNIDVDTSKRLVRTVAYILNMHVCIHAFIVYSDLLASVA
jgi:hypothetical protein